MLNFSFKIKTLWFENGVIKNISDKGFILLCVLHQYECRNIPNTSVASINMLYGEIKSLVNIRNKKEVIVLLDVLKKNNIVSFNKITDVTIANMFIFTDLPATHREEKDSHECDIPDSKADMYLIVDTETLNYILDKGYTIKHFITFLAVKKYTYSQQNTVSCDKISDWTGFGHNQINQKYLIDLEKITLIKNNIGKNKLGHRQNNFQWAVDFKNISKVVNF